MSEGLKTGAVEFPPGWKPPGPPPSPRQLRALVEGSIKEMGLTGPQAAAFRQKYRKWTGPYYPAPRPEAPEPIPIEKAAQLAATVGEQLGLDVDNLRENMGINKGGKP